jgi:ABC-type multidrug transport system ATPase subunit
MASSDLRLDASQKAGYDQDADHSAGDHGNRISGVYSDGRALPPHAADASPVLSDSPKQTAHTITYSSWGQFVALFVKSGTYQLRQIGTNLCQLIFPIVLIVFLYVLQIIVGNLISDDLEKTLQLNPTVEPANFIRFANPCPVQPFSTNPYLGRFVAAGDSAVLGLMPAEGTLNPGPGLLGAMRVSNGISSLPGFYMNVGKRDFEQALASFEECKGVSVVGTNIAAAILPAPVDAATISSNNDFIYDSWREVNTDLAGGWSFRELDVAARRIDMGVFYNKTLSFGMDIPAIVSVVTDALYRRIRGSTAPEVFFEYEGSKNYPRDKEESNFDIVTFAGPFLYLFMFQLLLPVFMSNAAAEKETRLREIVRMMGLKTHIYWIVSYIFNYIMYALVTIIIIILSTAFGFRIFTANAPGTYVLLFFCWGHVLVALAWWFSAFFSSSSTATVVGYLYVFGTGILAMTLLSTTFGSNASRGTVIAVQICPSFVLYRGLTALKDGVANDLPGITMDMIGLEWVPLREVYVVMFIEWIILMILAIYCELVVPSQYGVSRHPLFCIRKGSFFYSCFCSGKEDEEVASKSTSGVQHSSHNEDLRRGTGEYDLPADKHFPDDVTVVRRDALLNREDPIRLVNIVKVYPSREGGEFRAVDNLSLTVKKSECVGFLGPNGAGKSTTMNILCGYITATAGTAFLNGVDINEDMESVHMLMGICPQENIIWESLTAGEHLSFYGRLKGLSGQELEDDIIEKLEQVQLLEVRNKMAGEYSGGMKRRLCVAIALIGSPKIILLDEPTTGLDIGAKRNLWNVIKKVRMTSSVLMVTHSIEEATECCDRLCVMEKGQIATVDTLGRLEQRYVDSYRLTFALDDFSRQDEVKAFVEESISRNAKLTACLGGVMSFEVPKKDIAISAAFATIMAAKKRLGVIDWGVANTTLEEAITNMHAKNSD